MNIEFNKVTWYSKLLAVILFIAVLPAWTFYIGMQYERTRTALEQEGTTVKAPATISPATTKTYRSEKLGIEFKYPTSWGTLAEDNSEKGCLFGSIQATAEDQCDHVIITMKNDQAQRPLPFLSSESQLFVQDPNPRGGYWGDVIFIKSEADIFNYCKQRTEGDSVDCRVYKTKNNITVAKRSIAAGYNEYEGNHGAEVNYYIKSQSPLYPALAISTADIQIADRDAEKHIDALVESLTFVK